MKQHRILLFEDNLEVRNEVRSALRTTNHEIIAEAQKLERALCLLTQYDVLRFNVLLLDANLDGSDGKDACAIWDSAVKLQPRPTFIGISTNSLRYYGLPVPEKYDLTKIGIPRLPEVLDSLPEA
jgi:CheY-like chemotaxis protein